MPFSETASNSHIEELTLWIRLAGEQKIVTEFRCVKSSLDKYRLHSQSEELHYLNACEGSTLRLCNIARE
jgi:hypothetical protein